MAMALFNKSTEEHSAFSAGTKVQNENESLLERAKVSDGAKFVIELLEEEGVDAREFTSNSVTKEMLDDVDKVIVMSDKDSIPDWLSNSEKFEYWEVDDPQSWGKEDVRAIREQLRSKVEKLISE